MNIFFRSLTNLIVFFICLFCCSVYSVDKKTYFKKDREAYIATYLTSIESMDDVIIKNIYEYLKINFNNYCQSNAHDLKVECLISHANKNCLSLGAEKLVRQCEYISDVVVVNILSESVFVSRSDRYRILQENGQNFQQALYDYLQKKYAHIQVKFYLDGGRECREHDGSCLSKKLDSFCLAYSNTSNISWQNCVSAILWRMASSK